MRSTCLLLGLTGLALTLSSWIAQPVPLTLSLLAGFGLCALGGLQPIRFPGLAPLPLSLPLVGAIAIVSDVTAATTAGLLAGLTTMLASRVLSGDPSRPRESWSGGLGMAGALALAAGLASVGIAPPLEAGALPGAPLAPLPAEDLWTLAALALSFFLAAAASRAGLGQELGAGSLPWLAAASIGSGALGLGYVALISRTDRGLVDACLGCAGGAGAIAAIALARLRSRETAAVRRASTGLALVEALALAIEAKDRASERHLRRMRSLCLGIGRRLGMRAAELEALEYAALLHDIGKLVVPESILSKPAVLSSDEFQRVAAHARVGAEILETTALSTEVADMVRHHHERYDGSGYPDGLVGMEIPSGARILAVADTFEALTSDRPYRRGLPVSEALAHLETNAGTLYDPRVVRALAEEVRTLEEKEAGDQPGRPSPAPRAGYETVKVAPPLQAVLDRIASSHMEVYSLHEISQALGKSLNVEESFTLIAGKVQRLIHYGACVIWVPDPDGATLRARFAFGTAASRILELSLPMGEGLSGWAAAHQEACGGVMRGDLDPLGALPEAASLKAAAVAPLVVEDGLVGVLALYDAAEHDYAPHEVQLLSMIARQIAGAVRLALLFEKTQEHALTDSLTGLPNSRYLFMAFSQEAARAREMNAPLTLMVMDLDGFGSVNEGFGHSAGDRFLVGMAKAIRSQMRICDTCIRYSGDEFIALLPGMAGAEMEALAERLRDAAEAYGLEARPGRSVKLTLSLGWATLPDEGADFEQLMTAASNRLQRDKQREKRGRSKRDRIGAAAAAPPDEKAH